MSVRKKWKPGGRQRQRSASEEWLEKRKEDLSGDQCKQLTTIPPLVPRRLRKEKEDV